jgi:hypothetical protein
VNLTNYIGTAVKFVLIIFAQILLFKSLVIFEYAFCFVYIAFILFLPISIPHLTLLTIALVLGLSTDIFYDTAGIHTAASLVIAFVRPYFLNLVTPRGGYDNNSEISLNYMGFQWISIYTLPLFFIHHLLLFIIESFSFQNFDFVVLKSISSALYTYIIVLIYLRITEKD